MDPIYFSSVAEFRAWLEENHDKKTEVSVGYFKVGTGKPSMSWSDSVDEALCFGWIDGVRKSVDGERYKIRFTPRKPKSIWSGVNLRKVEKLLAEGRMRPPGIAAYEARTPEKSEIYSYEKTPSELPEDYLAQFQANEVAWRYFSAQGAYYRKRAIHWVTGAKQGATRDSRLQRLIALSEKHQQY